MARLLRIERENIVRLVISHEEEWERIIAKSAKSECGGGGSKMLERYRNN